MPCNHKFFEYLNLDNIGFEPEYLIIGTFNPEWPAENYANWFYGRTNNNYFWEILPMMFEKDSLRHSDHLDWKNFCAENKIAITDLILSINDADQENQNHYSIISNFQDTKFTNEFEVFNMTDIIGILNNYPSIKKVFFTRNQGVELFDDRINLIRNYCTENNIYFSYLLTPSKNARFQMRGYEPTNPNLERTLPNFIYEKWLENWNIEL